MKRVVVTGAGGLLGWHAHARLYAENCAARFSDMSPPYDIVPLDHVNFLDDSKLHNAVKGADAVLHFAGVNRASEVNEVETANPAIAYRLTNACETVASSPHIVYANSIQAASDTPYGRGKHKAAEVFSNSFERFTNLILPHIFGEGALPFYNNVTATLIHQIVVGDEVSVNPEGKVRLLHAGLAVQVAIDAISNSTIGSLTPEPRAISVPELSAKLQGFHRLYTANIYPDASDPFDLALFNSYRCRTYPNGWPRQIKLNTDARGTLFEAVKGGGGGQTFLSTSKPGVTRGDHFHFAKIERFLVVKGEAVIRVRKVLTNEIWEYHVSGDKPASVDIPTLHTHSIENVGTSELLTLFWTHDLFDPNNPDTYADKVQK